MKMTVPGRLATLCLLTTVFVGGCCSEEGGPRSECQTINAQTSTVIIRDYEYDRFCFFDLGLMGDTNVLAPGDSITKFVLFMNLDSNHTNWPLARAHIDWLHPGGSQPIAGRYGTIGHSYPTQYVLFPTVHYLYFPHEALHIDHVALAYFMIYRHPDGDVDTVGTIYGDTLDLQLLKVQDPSPTGPLWDAEWKNIYNLRCREIVYDGFELKV